VICAASWSLGFYPDGSLSGEREREIGFDSRYDFDEFVCIGEEHYYLCPQTQ